MTTVQTRQVPEVLVHTCDRLGPAETDWTRRWWLKFTGGSDGAGNVLGEATLEQDYGLLKPAQDGLGANVLDFGIEPNISTDPADPQDGTLEGLLVRLSRRTPDGTVTPFWWGVIHSHTVRPDGDVSGKAVWSAAGLPSVLEQVTINEGWVEPASGSTPFNPGWLPPFNKLTNGDRSESLATVNGRSVYVHDLTTQEGEGQYWTGRNIVDLLLAGFSKPRLAPDGVLYGWTWNIADPDECLAYIPETIDLDGMTLLEGINSIINARRGLTWYYTVFADVVTIHVLSTVPEAISVGEFSLPASSQQFSLVTNGNVWFSNVAIDYDESTTVDILEVHGAFPWAGITAEYPAGWEKGWDEDDEPDWEDDNAASELDAVWRRYKLKVDWPGTQAPFVGNTIGLGDTFARSGAGDAAYGYKGLTGERSHSGGVAAPPSTILKTERDLPIGLGFENNRLGLRHPPILVFYDGSTYEDVTNAESSYHLQIDDNPPQIIISTEDNGLDAKNRLSDDGAKFYVTLGIREATPLRVSWQRPPMEWPRRMPRVKVIKVPHAELWYMTAECVTGVNGEGVVTTSGGRVTIRDDTETLRAVLALARAWFTVPSVRASWTDRGTLDIDEQRRPGALLATMQRGSIFTVNNVVTRRRWDRVMRDGCEMWDTSYETTRMVPDIKGVL